VFLHDLSAQQFLPKPPECNNRCSSKIKKEKLRIFHHFNKRIDKDIEKRRIERFLEL
jgi:hypothetical protein